jgi:hypothetical protein
VKQGENLKISNVKKIPNILQIPIYSLATFRNIIILAGGGGNEIQNKIQVYKLGGNELSTNILKTLTHEESTGKDVANFMACANNVSKTV